MGRPIFQLDQWSAYVHTMYVCIGKPIDCILYPISGKWKHTFVDKIDLCSFDSSNEIVAYSEYTVMMDESTAKVCCLQEKLSREAFGGSAFRLLNSKNILIADTEGTQGIHDNYLDFVYLV